MRFWTKAFYAVLMAGFLLAGTIAGGAEKGDATVFSFAQLCDTQLGMNGFADDLGRFERAIELINNAGVDFVVICGDLVNKADDTSYQEFLKARGKFKVPCYCVPGNHDSLQKMKEILNCEVPYEVLHKGRAFLFLNSQLWLKQAAPGASTQQDAWLAEMLAKHAASATPIFIIQHIPLFKSKVDEEDKGFNLPIAKRMELLKLFKEKGVVAVLAGHTHNLGINEYSGIQFVCGETTSRNFDSRPYGFRIWRVKESGPCALEFVPLEENRTKVE